MTGSVLDLPSERWAQGQRGLGVEWPAATAQNHDAASAGQRVAINHTEFVA